MGSSNNEPQTTTTSGWQPALDAGKDIIGAASGIYEQMANANVPQLGLGELNSNLMGAWNQMSGQGMNNLAQQMGQYGSQMMGGLGQLEGLYSEIGKGMNTYNQQNYRDTMLADREGYFAESDAATMNALNEATANATGQIYGQAAGGGNVGSSRTQLAAGTASGQLAGQAQATMAGIRNQAFDTASNQAMMQEQQRLAALQAQASGIMGQAQMGAGMLGQAGSIYQQGIQNQLQAGMGQMEFEKMNQLIDYQNQLAQYNAPWQNLGQYNAIVNPWMGGSQTSTTTGAGPDRWGQLIGAGATIAGGMLMSDARLKTNIKKTGVDDWNGLTTYKWDWVDNVEELTELPTSMFDYNEGYLAHEVKDKYPEAVIELPSGYLVVDYSQLV